MEEAPIELDRSNRYTMKRVPRIRYAYRSTTLDTSLPYIYIHKLYVLKYFLVRVCLLLKQLSILSLDN